MTEEKSALSDISNTLKTLCIKIPFEAMGNLPSITVCAQTPVTDLLFGLYSLPEHKKRIFAPESCAVLKASGIPIASLLPGSPLWRGPVSAEPVEGLLSAPVAVSEVDCI